MGWCRFIMSPFTSKTVQRMWYVWNTLGNAVTGTQYGKLAEAGFRRPFFSVFIIRRCVARRRGWTGLDRLAFKSKLSHYFKTPHNGGDSVNVRGRTCHTMLGRRCACWAHFDITPIISSGPSTRLYIFCHIMLKLKKKYVKLKFTATKGHNYHKFMLVLNLLAPELLF